MDPRQILLSVITAGSTLCCYTHGTKQEVHVWFLSIVPGTESFLSTNHIFFSNEVTPGGLWDNSRMGATHQEHQPVMRGPELSVSCPSLQEGEGPDRLHKRPGRCDDSTPWGSGPDWRTRLCAECGGKPDPLGTWAPGPGHFWTMPNTSLHLVTHLYALLHMRCHNASHMNTGSCPSGSTSDPTCCYDLEDTRG